LQESKFPIDEACAKVALLSEILEYFNPETDNFDDHDTMHGLLNELISLQPQLQFGLETENDLAVLGT
jgi:hypothetical protein